MAGVENLALSSKGKHYGYGELGHSAGDSAPFALHWILVFWTLPRLPFGYVPVVKKFLFIVPGSCLDVARQYHLEYTREPIRGR